MDNEKLLSYWDDIPVGRENAASYLVLREWWHCDERQVRRILHDLSRFDNGDDYILIRSGKNRGFYKTDDPEQIKAFRRECLNKGKSVFAPVRKINRVLRNNVDQYSFENNLRVVRESLGFQQSIVCAYVRRYDPAFDVPMLSKMENGYCLPTPAQLNGIAELYNCQPTDLINI